MNEKNLSVVLQREFYTRHNVVQIAEELLGKVLYTSIDGEITAGIIVETEAYEGVTDKASHAYNNRRTSRTEVMYRNGGTAYVYLCYGIHSLFNIVTSVENDPHAVLIRGIQPYSGVGVMCKRSGRSGISIKNGIGPGNVAKLMGIKVIHSGLDMCSATVSENRIWVQDDGIQVMSNDVIVGPRVGIAYAAEHALLPYRFRWAKK
jgi:DNA-3-methyladenine glycosylase